MMEKKLEIKLDHTLYIFNVKFLSPTSLSNGEDFITTEQLQRRMRNLSSPSTSNQDSLHDDSQSNITSNNLSQKRLNDDDNDCFPRNGLPDDSSTSKDEDRANDIQSKKVFF